MDKLTLNQVLQRGIEAHKAGQVQEADRLYSAILKVHAKHPEVNHNMGMLAVDVGKIETALAFFKIALETDPSVAQFWFSYIDVLIKLEHLADARTVFDQAKNNGARGENFDRLEQRLKKATGKIHKTVTVDKKTERSQSSILDNMKLDQALKLAKKKIKDGFEQEAEHIYKDILLKFPRNKKAIHGLKVLSGRGVGKVSYVQGPAQEQVQLVISLYKQGQLQQAYKQVETLVQQFPKSFVLFNIQGTILKGLGKLELAVEAYKKALTIKPDFADAHYNLGNALKEQGVLQEAVEAYKKALAIKPDFAKAYNNLGYALKEQGKMEEAIEAYQKALAIKPDFPEAYNNLGITLKEQGNLQEAIEAYRKALAIKPDFHEAYNNIGVTFKEQGKLQEAIEACKKALDIMPDYTAAIENFQSLAVQLLPIMTNYGYKFDAYGERLKSEIVLRPKYQVQHAIKAYLEANFTHAVSYNNNYRGSNQKLLDMLEPKDKIFCNAYSIFLEKLVDASWNKEPDINNKVYHLGESHCLSYAHRNIKIDSLSFRISPRITFGAKAFHFARTEQDSYKAITKAHFMSLPKNSTVFLSYGEIDCRPDEGFISAVSKLNKPLGDIIDSTTSGYVQWFLKQNELQGHHLYFVNVPAPVYDVKLTAALNSEVAKTVELFNSALKKYVIQYGLKIIDVFNFTVGDEGFSNGHFHIDNRHLGEKALIEIERQLR